MTVKELIDQLSTLDPNTRVFVRGYEDGFDDVNSIRPTDMVLNVNDVWYYGKHDTLDNRIKRDEILRIKSEHPSVKGIILGYEDNSIG